VVGGGGGGGVVVVPASVYISVLFADVLIAYVQILALPWLRLLLVYGFSPPRLRCNPRLVRVECVVSRVALGRFSSSTTVFQSATH
jgi:hypothetical protein